MEPSPLAGSAFQLLVSAGVVGQASFRKRWRLPAG